MTGFRTLWAALVGMYDDTLVMIGGNVAALVLNVPVYVVLLVIVDAATGEAPETLVLAILATFMVFLPTPGNLALAGVAQAAAGADVARLRLLTETLRARWGIAWRCTLVSVVVLIALLWNVVFYLNLEATWALPVALLWIYGTIVWLSLHIYVVPLAVHVARPRVLDLYRRAVFVALGHAVFTFVLLVLLLIVTFVSVVFLPIYVLAGQSFVSLAQAHALREIRRRHGDLAAEPEEEGVGRT
ncbi:MAG: hypothetical protein JO057_06500 [Chloroflexi bacterium]|nr:hypothetical protein [Chloroflexota bacterium]